MNLQEIITQLNTFYARQGCVLAQPYDMEVGAGTFNPLTFFGALSKQPWRVAYVQPSRRPADGRYGDNPNRLFQHHQYQVIIKPPPENIQDIYLQSLQSIGIDPLEHDIRFVEDDWESPTLGATGLGWEVWCDGMEITQYTYFQQIGSVEVDPICVELTYGLERIAMFLAGRDNVFNIQWNDTWSYEYLRKKQEYQYSKYCFEEADSSLHFQLFNEYEKECRRLIERSLVYPAYDYVLKCSHVFNVLEARGAISVTERTGFITRIRTMARACAETFLETVAK